MRVVTKIQANKKWVKVSGFYCTHWRTHAHYRAAWRGLSSPDILCHFLIFCTHCQKNNKHVGQRDTCQRLVVPKEAQELPAVSYTDKTPFAHVHAHEWGVGWAHLGAVTCLGCFRSCAEEKTVLCIIFSFKRKILPYSIKQIYVTKISIILRLGGKGA
jgi:hypothetical protein